MRQWLPRFLSRLGFVWARRRLDEESRREIDAHIALLAERHVRAGLPPDEAYAAARRDFGSVTRLREDLHEMNGLAWVDGAIRDLRYAGRQLRRSPGFFLVVMATLALGIGGATAVFSVVHAVLLAPLPYDQPGQLVRLYQQEPDNPASRALLSATHFVVLREHASLFEEVAALDTYSERGLDLVKDGQAQRLRVLRVTSDYFRTLRSDPTRGRGFDPEDERGTRRVVLSDALWRTRFGSDPSIVGTAIELSAQRYEVAGIAPPGFDDPIAEGIDVWMPYNVVGDTAEDNHSLSGIGRLRQGVRLEQAQAELATLSQSMKERWPGVRRGLVVARPLQEDLVAAASGPLHLLLIAVGLVLLVACVNVGNLTLVRATSRVSEFAIRAALGSGRGRIARQLLVESTLLAALGGLLGLALAAFGVNVLQRVGREAIPRLDAIGIEPTVLAFAAFVTLMTVVVFGVAPALRSAGVAPNGVLGSQTRATTGTRGQGWLRSGLAATQLALALTLLVGAGVLLVSFVRLQQVPLGFRVERVLTFGVSLPTVRYDAARRAAFHEDLARRLAAIPGVAAAGGTSRLPATGSFHPWNTRIDTGPLAGTSVRSPVRIQQRTVSGDFFAALDIPLLAGRTFDARDTAAIEGARPADGGAPDTRQPAAPQRAEAAVSLRPDPRGAVPPGTASPAAAPLRAVVGAAFARHAFPDLPFDAAIGQRISVAGERREIIGVVGDVTLDVYGTPALVVYHPHRQVAGNRNWALTQVVATALPPAQIVTAVRAAVAAIDPALVVYRAAPMTDVIGRGAGRERFALVLMGAFAAVSLSLATVGLYGVLAYGVRQRTREIGIRIALGATAAQVRALVLRQAAVVLGVGLAAGLAGAAVLGRWLTSLVFEISPWDPRILLATALLLIVTGLLAAWLPARRASRVMPRMAMQDGR